MYISSTLIYNEGIATHTNADLSAGRGEGADMDITLEQIKEAIEHGYPVTVIINGEYYNFTGEGEKND